MEEFVHNNITLNKHMTKLNTWELRWEDISCSKPLKTQAKFNNLCLIVSAYLARQKL